MALEIARRDLRNPPHRAAPLSYPSSPAGAGHWHCDFSKAHDDVDEALHAWLARPLPALKPGGAAGAQLRAVDVWYSVGRRSESAEQVLSARASMPAREEVDIERERRVWKIGPLGVGYLAVVKLSNVVEGATVVDKAWWWHARGPRTWRRGRLKGGEMRVARGMLSLSLCAALCAARMVEGLQHHWLCCLHTGRKCRRGTRVRGFTPRLPSAARLITTGVSAVAGR